MDKRVSVRDAPSLKWQSECGRYTVSILPACLDAMLQIAGKYHPHEVGTSLIGRYSEDGFDAYVIDVAPLSSDSRGTARAFRRGVRGLRGFYAWLRRHYQGKRYYVGEWHSHPNALPVPSRIDDLNQAIISANVKTNCPESILVIVGGDPFEEPNLGVYVYSRVRGRVDLIRQRSSQDR